MVCCKVNMPSSLQPLAVVAASVAEVVLFDDGLVPQLILVRPAQKVKDEREEKILMMWMHLNSDNEDVLPPLLPFRCALPRAKTNFYSIDIFVTFFNLTATEAFFNRGRG